MKRKSEPRKKDEVVEKVCGYGALLVAFSM